MTKTLTKALTKTTIKAVLFDLDGTLVDSEALFVRALQEVLADYHCSLSSAQLAQIVYGRSRVNITSEVLALFPHIPLGNLDLSDAIDLRFERYVAMEDVVIAPSQRVLKHCIETYPTCIVSGSTRYHIERFSEMLGVSGALDFYIGAEDYSAGKPDPTCFLMAAEKLGIEPAACLVFEDSSVGVRAAKAAGMYCVALQRPGAQAQDLSMADCIVSSLEEFTL